MSEDRKAGVLIVGHGSRREEANDDVREAARCIGKRGGFALIEAAFLEIERPNICEGFARLIARGAQNITVHPYFLSPGRHTRGDIPVAVREAAAQHPGVNYRITEPLSAHPLVIEAAVERIYQTAPAARQSSGTGADQEVRKEPTPASCCKARPGTAYLVGAGPGDPGLLTIKAHQLLNSCDLVLYDYLVSPEIIQSIPTQVERLYAGKVGGGRQTSQEEINALLISHARNGRRVVRLKGGDPFLFGRGAEEAEALRAAGVPFEVVPGITSALAVPAYAGIPLTHRELASSVTVLTGAHAGDDEGARDLATPLAATIVVLMGMTHLREIASDLIAAGRSADTPAAVIRWGTYDGQQTITGSLRTIADEADRAGMRPPAVIVIGEVVKLRERLKWFENSVVGSAEHVRATVIHAAQTG